jgi:hypothetical protein
MITYIGTKDIFVNYRYTIYVDDDLEFITMRGAHAIIDGGYHNWLHTISGTKEGTSVSADEERWSGTMEPVRKDAERTFGNLKKMFRVLHVKSSLHKSRSIDTIFSVIQISHLFEFYLIACVWWSLHTHRNHPPTSTWLHTHPSIYVAGNNAVSSFLVFDVVDSLPLLQLFSFCFCCCWGRRYDVSCITCY